MKLTNGKETIELHDKVQIKAFTNNGWSEVVAVKKQRKVKDEAENKD
jgi:hypothetical protein